MFDHSSIHSLHGKKVKFPLFDIDGTLLKGGNKIHGDALNFALHTVYEQPHASIDEIQKFGMIDTRILIDVLKRHGVSEKESQKKMNTAMQAAAEYYEEHKDKGFYSVLDGVTDILEELKKRNVPIGLLTGNIEQIGWTKMEMAGIKDYFTYGAFGSHAFERVDLIKIAQENLKNILGIEIPLERFVIIGDTPLDIACARLGGIEVIAVATGNYSAEDLQKEGADLVVETLHETKKILQFLNKD